MKRLIYAASDYNVQGMDPNYNKFRQLQTSGILLPNGFPFPRNYSTEDHKAFYPIKEPQQTPISYAEATEARAAEIIKHVETNDLPIVVMWSGGIDSTTIMTAIMKNFSPSLMKRLVVRMNNASYVENPTFFRNVINKNSIAYTQERKYDYNNATIIHGDPADALWLPARTLNFNAEHPGAHNYPLTKDIGRDITLRHVAGVADAEYAEWLFNYITAEASASGYPLNTISDFFWWIIFNYNYSSICLRHLGEVVGSSSNINLENYTKNFVLWYNTKEYQSWSWQAQVIGSKFYKNIRSYKMEAKQYIYAYDKNPWYRDYKTKVQSHYTTSTESSILSAVYEDGEIVLNA